MAYIRVSQQIATISAGGLARSQCQTANLACMDAYPTYVAIKVVVGKTTAMLKSIPANEHVACRQASKQHTGRKGNVSFFVSCTYMPNAGPSLFFSKARIDLEPNFPTSNWAKKEDLNYYVHGWLRE